MGSWPLLLRVDSSPVVSCRVDRSGEPELVGAAFAEEPEDESAKRDSASVSEI